VNQELSVELLIDPACFLSRPSANCQRFSPLLALDARSDSSLGPAADHENLMRVDMRRARLAFCGFVFALLASFDVAHADPCQTILEEFKTLSARANREVESTVANLREAVSDVRDDKTRIELIARSCVAAAEALGVFKSYRIAVSGCMGERAAGRSDALDALDRSISRLRVSLDKACR
jgi:hypothetical protein